VKDTHPETRLYTRLNGEPAVGVVISKQSGANTVATAQSVMQQVEKVKKIHPNLTFNISYDQSTFISESIDNVRDSALIGGVLAILILLFFLRNFRSTLVVALSIPTSIISTFALLYMCGFTLNTMSLGGLALATGLIVDDAVVVLENIFRHIERDKKTSVEAAVSATGEILSAVVASTWTIMVVFLPLLLIKGQAGQMFTQFALVVIFSLGVSLLDASTVVPMLASRVIHGEAHHEMLSGESTGIWDRMFVRAGKWFDAMDNAYRRGLRWALRHRFWVLGTVAALTVASFSLLPFIGTEMMPATDSGDFTVVVKLPVGTALDKTNAVMRQVERIVLSNPEVSTAFSAAGTTISSRGGTTSLTPHQGSVTVKLKDGHKTPTAAVMRQIRQQVARIPGTRPQVSQFDLVSMIMTGGNQNVEVDFFGDDLSELSRLGRDAMARMRNVSGLENLDVNWQEAMPEVHFTVDRQKALQLGVTFTDIANTINTATNGSIASYYQEKGFQYPIKVQLPETDRKTIPQLEDLVIHPSLPPSDGAAPHEVTLGQVAKPETGMGPSEISRQDRQRYIAVSGQPQGRSPSEIQADVQKVLADLQLPQGYYWDWGTNQKRQQEEFAGMGVAVILAIALIYMLLASQFESFVHPLTVLASVPVSAIGVILALFLTGRSFGLTAFVGLLMLVGIVVKNGILLVDYTNHQRAQGLKRDEAILVAGPTRLRPILMTASAAILGMLPLALGVGKGSETQAPMATAVIGGLTTSTMLTLFVVPCVYTIFDDLANLFHRRRQAGRDEPSGNGKKPAEPTPDVMPVGAGRREI
ncbi:MAG TPA: efflux RND transporter permease subunit, partial [Armatimonadota bacterium]